MITTVARVRGTVSVCFVALAAILVCCLALAWPANAATVKVGNGGKLLPAGFLSVKGAQIVDSHGHNVRIASVGWSGSNDVDSAPIGIWGVNYKVTMDGMVEDGFNCFRMSWVDAGLHSTKVCDPRSVNYTENPELRGLTQMQVLDKIIAYAGQIGLKVILDHHTDEGIYPGTDQQRNGLWYDVGPGTDGTDGAKHTGTVTDAQFVADWVEIAKRYAGNSTVVGFDLDNEPFVTSTNGLNWGKGGTGDICAAYTRTGIAIQQVDPGALIICEGPMDDYNHGSLLYGRYDLSHVVTSPVVLHVPHKVVYSVHEYPNEVADRVPDSGPGYIKVMNAQWGYLVRDNIAPVWIGEMGASVTPTDTDGNAWAATLIPYVNGKDGDQGGPTFKPGRQPISTDWWFWGTFNVGDGWGTLSTWKPTVFVPRQQAITNQLLFR
jgi:aryl-phospho-beta-D-glucosidase BglC (GH1 family)